MRPNVLLIVADQWRGDCLGVAGHPDVKTPYLDSLAARGAYFTNAYSNTPSCVPARAALFTGMRQEHHGRVGYRDRVPWRYEHTLAGEFTKGGYQTQCVGKMHVYPLRSRQGFENVKLHDGYLHAFIGDKVASFEHQLTADDYMYELAGQGHKNLLDTGLECVGWETRPWMYDERLHPTHWVGDQAVDFLRSRDRDKPFFLMMSFVRPHSPLDPPESYLAPYRAKHMRAPFTGDWAPPYGPRMNTGAHGMSDEEQTEEAQRAYYALMTQVDHQIGRIFEILMTNGELKDTIVMFAADHGDMMGDHHLYQKCLPYEGSAHVPLIMAGPGIAKGTTVDTPVELMDIMPTLLDFADIEIPGTVDGVSAKPLILGGNIQREYLHGEHAYGDMSSHWIVTKRDKYIWFSVTGQEQYFDLENDPNELHDAINDEKCSGRVDELRKILIKELAGREEGYVKDGKLTTIEEQDAVLSFLRELK